MGKKVALHNLGCKVNSYELESMQQQLEAEGYEVVPFGPGADLYVINTCTVTNIADRKSRQMLHKAKKMNPNAVVAAVGCYAQIKGEELEKDPAIDLVIGNNQKNHLASVLQEYLSSGEKQTALEDLSKGRNYEEMHLDRIEAHTRAFLKVQDGCDQFCSYCIIPYARGRVRSRRADKVVSEVERLVRSGCREVVLTGIHLCSYGRDFGEKDALLELIRQVHDVEGLQRIRLGSLEPGSIDRNFVREIAALPKVCPHFHLSLQSGCNRTLRRMNRRYTAEQFAETADWFRQEYAEPALTTDIIAGFPGETDEDFAECVRFVEKIHFFETHIFPYSRRAGTKAAVMPDQLTDREKKARCAVLHRLDMQRRKTFLQRHIGKPVEVLFEEPAFLDGTAGWLGHTAAYEKVLLPSPDDLTNVLRIVTPQRISADDVLIAGD